MRKDTPLETDSALSSFQNSADDTGTLRMVPEEYREHLEDFDLTPEQEVELLQILWNIMATMVDLGWGLDNIQITETLRQSTSAMDQQNRVQNNIAAPNEGKENRNGERA